MDFLCLLCDLELSLVLGMGYLGLNQDVEVENGEAASGRWRNNDLELLTGALPELLADLSSKSVRATRSARCISKWVWNS